MPDTLVGERAKYNADQLKTMAKNGQALPDGSYPIADREDLQNAIHAVGRGSGSHDAIRRHIIARAKALGASDLIPDNWNADGSMMNSASTGQYSERSVDFDLVRSEDGDGLTLEGYAAVFNSPTQIRDFEGEYTETIAPGAFNMSIRTKPPVLMFEHGQHPLVGSVPIGAIQTLKEDARGLYIKARLFDSWLTLPVRQAIQAGAVKGMSFRFKAIKEQWNAARNVRTLKELQVPELGPVVFPAYPDTSVALRSTFPEVFEQIEAADSAPGLEVIEALRAELADLRQEIAELSSHRIQINGAINPVSTAKQIKSILAASKEGSPQEPATARSSDGPAVAPDPEPAAQSATNDHSLAARQRVARLTRARRMGAGR